MRDFSITGVFSVAWVCDLCGDVDAFESADEGRLHELPDGWSSVSFAVVCGECVRRPITDLLAAVRELRAPRRISPPTSFPSPRKV